jgi:hypothetical protein
MTVRTIRRAATTVVAAGTALLVAALPATAHECFNTQRAAQAEAMIAQHSHGWFDIQTWQLFALFVGTPCDSDCAPVPPTVQPLLDAETSGDLSPDTVVGVIFGAPESSLGDQSLQDAFDALVAFTHDVADAAAELGVPTHYLTLAHATAAGGAPEKVATDGKGIDHFPDVYGDRLFQAYLSVFCTDFPADPVCA